MIAAHKHLPVTLDAKLRPAGSALVVIDMQNDFCAPGGYIDKTMGKDVAGAKAVVEPIARLLADARAAGVPVFWVRADYTHDTIPDSMLVKLISRGIDAECCKPGTWGHDWFGVAPLDGEAIVTKHSYSGFAATDLEDKLKAAGVKTLVFTGVQTQVCVESTLRDAHSLGYFCVVPQDAVGSHTPPQHDATLINVRFLFGDVCDSADVSKAWAAR
jgi:ureidoacrylate peracid hydrolase